ncbi:hypothetical protein CYMTET_10014 [Cymbomonas tetramitiformis]|uniref:Transmembrane protein 19 n=1 Tax=Cymbomonas tetramitiformis TaxID=36881 RepID=A0AAE0LE93_9CHLO|nr:hypothetical protein CYMTET_10014 [Cymbomonas tetramitiformis]
MKIRSRGSKLAINASFVETASQTASDLILSSSPGVVPALCVNSSVFLLGLPVLLGGLTPAGVAHSWFLGTMVFGAFGGRGYLLVCIYFILGSAVTKLKLKQKQAEGIAEARSGRRSPASVWGSGIAGVACAIAALSTPSTSLQYLFRIGFIASFTSKLSDTVSSEVGKAYGKTTYLSTTFKTVPRGTEGAVSLEGTVAGAGAAVPILVGMLPFKYRPHSIA